MSRPRKTRTDLPKYVRPIHGALWWHPTAPKGQKRPKPVRICAAHGEDHLLWKFMADLTMPVKMSPSPTLGELLDRYLRDELPKLRPRTQEDYRAIVGRLRSWGGHFPAADIKPRDFGKLLVTGKGKASRVKMLAVASSVYRKAIGEWFVDGLEINPLASVVRPKGGKRKRYVTDAEFEALYKLMPLRMQIAMDLAYVTGQRQGDLLSLEWSQVDATPLPTYPHGAIYFDTSKTGKRLMVGISEDLKGVLDRARKLVPQMPRRYVLRTRKGKPYNRNGFRTNWQRGMNKAMKGWYDRKKQFHPPVLQERFTFHDLRAKNISDSANLQDAMERAGHTSMAMTRGVYDRGIRLVKPLK